MENSINHPCKLCGQETYEIFAYPHTLAEVIPFKGYEKVECVGVEIEGNWRDVSLRVCPRCGHVQGEVND